MAAPGNASGNAPGVATAEAAAHWQARFATGLLEPGLPPPDGLQCWNGSDPGKRFDVYRNNVAVNLVDGLCETFPVCLELVGEEFFRAMAHVFVRENPPVSRLLHEYGSAFAGFIEGFEPARELPYLPDVARLEFARVESYHAADAQPLSAAAWQEVAPEALPQAAVTPHPGVRLLHSNYAAASLWAAHQGAMDIASLDPDTSEDALVTRQHLEVEVFVLPPGGRTFMQALMVGDTLGEAASKALASHEQFDLAANLGLLMTSGFAVSLKMPAQDGSIAKSGQST